MADGERPPILLLRTPTIDLPPAFRAHVLRRYSLVDPADAAACAAVRVVLCVAYPPIDAATLRRLPALELVVGTTAGLDHIDLAECRRRGIAVTNAGPVFAEDVADYAVGLLFGVLRRVPAAERFVRRGLWRLRGDYPLGSKVGGKRVGVVGLGSIGSMVAKRLQAFGCIISYTSRTKNPSALYPYYANIHDLATNNDALVLCCSLTDKTRHIVNEEVMRVLGKGGVIVNIGRGALVDEAALVRALVKGQTGGAGLDVFENEPKVPSELYEMDNVVLSPHKAALTSESFVALEGLVMRNLEALFLNKPLLSAINDQ